jgi:hypothetical protein
MQKAPYAGAFRILFQLFRSGPILSGPAESLAHAHAQACLAAVAKAILTAAAQGDRLPPLSPDAIASPTSPPLA